jgi:hypothetical protein
MNLFSKNLEHLLGASYLSGAAEALVKSKSLNSQQFEKNLDELKQVRKSLLQKAESDGHSDPKLIIEGAKKVAYKVLKNEIPTTDKKENNILKDVEEPSAEEPSGETSTNSPKNSNIFGLSNTPENSSNITNSPTNSYNLINSPKNSSTELMPIGNNLKNISTTNLPTKPPPPVLQLGGRKSKKSKRSKSKSRKHRK